MTRKTKDIKYRRSLMYCAGKYGVSRASRKHSKGRACIFRAKALCRQHRIADLTVPQTVRHLHQYTEQGLKPIRHMRRRNPSLGMVKLERK